MGKFTRISALTLSAALASSVAFAGTAMATTDGEWGNVGDSSGTWSQDVARLAGETRYDTAIKVANAQGGGHNMGEENTANELFITGGDAFPDSLAVAPVADCANAPVLLTPSRGTNAQIMAYIKDKMPSVEKITLVGGPLSVDAGLEKALKAIKPGVTVERVAGETRYETAYKLNADHLAYCYGIERAQLDVAKNTLAALVAAEERYQDAVDAFNKASADYLAKKAALEAAQAELAALMTELATLSQSLQDVPGAPTAAEVAEQLAIYTQLNDEAKAVAAAASVFIDDLGAIPGQGNTTLDIKSTIAQYKAAFPARAAAIQAAQTKLGVADTDTLEEAIAIAKGKVAAANAARDAEFKELADMVYARQKAAAANAHNAPILEKMGVLAGKIVAAQEKVDAAQAAYDAALAKLTAARAELAAATAGRPLPQQIGDAIKAVAVARDNVLKAPASGEHSVFLADGTTFQNALAAAPAAASRDGVLMLSQGSVNETWTKKYLSLTKAQVVAVGDAAVAAIGTNVADKIAGSNVYQVAADVTKRYFNHEAMNSPLNDNFRPVAVVSGESFADAVLAASFIADNDGGILLTQKTDLTAPTTDYLRFIATKDTPVRLVGGPMWLDESLLTKVNDALKW